MELTELPAHLPPPSPQSPAAPLGMISAVREGCESCRIVDENQLCISRVFHGKKHPMRMFEMLARSQVLASSSRPISGNTATNLKSSTALGRNPSAAAQLAASRPFCPFTPRDRLFEWDDPTGSLAVLLDLQRDIKKSEAVQAAIDSEAKRIALVKAAKQKKAAQKSARQQLQGRVSRTQSTPPMSTCNEPPLTSLNDKPLGGPLPLTALGEAPPVPSPSAPSPRHPPQPSRETWLRLMRVGPASAGSTSSRAPHPPAMRQLSKETVGDRMALSLSTR